MARSLTGWACQPPEEPSGLISPKEALRTALHSKV